MRLAWLLIAAAALEVSGGWFWEEEKGDLNTPLLQMDGALMPWGGESGTEQCNFWNGTYEWSLGLCSHFAISRLGHRVESEGVERAVKCAARHSTDCVLAPEIGVGLPAVFLYDSKNGMRLLLAPRMLEIEPMMDEMESLDVRIHDPSDESASRVLAMRRRVRVEFITTKSKALQVETLSGVDAFCVQLLRSAVAQSCWDALD